MGQQRNRIIANLMAGSMLTGGYGYGSDFPSAPRCKITDKRPFYTCHRCGTFDQQRRYFPDGVDPDGNDLWICKRCKKGSS